MRRAVREQVKGGADLIKIMACHDTLEFTDEELHAVIDEAQRIVPQIQACETAGPGLVQTLEHVPLTFCIGKTLLCRNKKPLIKLAYRLMKNNIQPRMAGKDIAASLKATLRRVKAKSIPEAIEKLEKLADAEIKDCKSDSAAETMRDKFDSLLSILESLPSSMPIPEVAKSIDELFSDGPGQVFLSTIHKAKGREFPSVILLSPELIPSRFATLDWQIEQEYNLLYVAITRAQQELFYVHAID
jgi:hypothetical protein